jgi:hypothetical protein
MRCPWRISFPVWALFQQGPTPQQIKVERLKFLRDAKADDQFDRYSTRSTARSERLSTTSHALISAGGGEKISAPAWSRRTWAKGAALG